MQGQHTKINHVSISQEQKENVIKNVPFVIAI